MQIAEFLEKPADPPGLVDSPDESFASMGNYVFTTDALVEALERDAENPDSRHDMGGDIIPMIVDAARRGVYDFKRNDVPGSTAEGPRLLARRRDAARRTTRRTSTWCPSSRSSTSTTRSGRSSPTHVQLPGREVRRGRPTADDSHRLRRGRSSRARRVRASVLGDNIYVATGAVVDRSVLMDNVKIGRGRPLATRSSTRTSSCPTACEIGVDPEADRGGRVHGHREGITVLGKGQHIDGTYTGPR